MIRVGIGGWSFAPWRQTFYPPGTKAKDELAFASRRLTSIEINATFHRTQSAASFAKWRDETPDGFVFAVKAHRSVMMRQKPAEAAEGIAWFLGSGVAELGDKLGPINWQLPPHRQFDPAAIGAFLDLLPRELAGRPLRHVIEVRHPSFVDPAFVALARQAGVAIVCADSPKYPQIADSTAGFTYARLMNAAADEETGYPAAALDLWAGRAGAWAAGQSAVGLPLLAPEPALAARRDAFVYVINGAKERAPAAAAALISKL